MFSSAELKKKILKLLKEDEEFRYAVAGLIGLDEILKKFEKHDEELVKLRRDMIEGFRRHDKEIAELRAEIAQLRRDMIEGFKRHDAEIAELRAEMVKLRRDMLEGFRLLERHINALGTRWGLLSEEAFREGLRGIVEKELGFKVERWSYYDSEGIVYGYPSQVEVDVVVHDEKILLIEITSHAKVSDVYELKRKAVLYEKATGRRVDKLMIVTPYADEKALEAAKELDVEVYTKV